MRLAQRLQLPFGLDDRLLELDFGAWDGRTYAQVWQQEQEAVMAFWHDPAAYPPPGGESMATFSARLQALEDHLLQDCARQPDGRAHVLLLTHGGVIRGLLGRHLGLAANQWSQLRIDTGSLSRLTLGRDGAHRWFELSFMNRTGID